MNLPPPPLHFRRKLTRAYTRALPFAIACAALLIGACSQAVKSAEPEPDPEPAPMIQPTLLGTWRTVHYDRDDGVLFQTNTVTITFTETHFFEQQHAQDTDGRTRGKGDNAGTVSRTDTTVTKSFVEDNRMITVVKDYLLVEDGNVLVIDEWHASEQPSSYSDRFTRVVDAPSMTSGQPSSLHGTWRRSGAWTNDEDETIESIDIITFTASRSISDGVEFNDDNNEVLDTWTWSAGWIDHVSGGSATRIEPGHSAVVKQYVIAGDLLAINHWGDNEPREDFAVFTRVHDPIADLVGRWNLDYEDDDEAFNVKITIGDDGSFHRVFTLEKTSDEDRIKSHTVTGTYELDTAEKFIFVTITETLFDGELGDDPFWRSGEILRFAYAPSNNPTQILMSNPWSEQEYDHDQGMKVDNPEFPYGDYWERLTKVE